MLPISISQVLLLSRSTSRPSKMRFQNNIFIIIVSVPFLVYCQTVPTNAFGKFYLKTPSSLMQRTNFTALYHLMRKGQSWPDPKANDKSEYRLRQLLGNYVSNYLSTQKPKDFTNGPVLNSVSEEELLKTMPDSLKSFQFNLPKSNRKRHPRSKTQLLFRLWLWSISYCPVQYRWTDLGPYVWPRYMKIGYCPKKSCSFPSGMSCQPSKKDVKVKVLLWYCTRSKYCSWRVYSENLTTECKCQCH